MTRAVAAWVMLLGACGPTVIWSGKTPDRAHRVEVIADAGLQYVVIDGERRAAYHGVAGWSIAFSGGHLAFAAQVGQRWVVVRDGHSEQPWDAIGQIELASNGRLAYVANHGAAWQVVADGQAGPSFDAILAGTLRWSRDGRRLAYVGESSQHVRAVVDGQLGPVFDGIGGLAFSDDGARCAYVARTLLEAHIVADGVASAPWSAVGNLTLAPGHVAYAASDGAHWRVVVDGEPGPAVDRVRRIVFSKDGLHHAWVARVADGDVLALDDAPIATAPRLRPEAVAFRPAPGASPGLAYVVPDDAGGEQVVIDGARGPHFDEVGAPTWSRDGRLAYAARRGDSWLVIAFGRELPGGTQVGQPVWSGDSRHLAYAVHRGKLSFAIVDGRAYRFDLLFDDTLTFSSDNARWAVIAGDLGQEKLFVAIDGRPAVPLHPSEIYSAAARGGSDDVLRAWTQAEVDRAAAPGYLSPIR